MSDDYRSAIAYLQLAEQIPSLYEGLLPTAIVMKVARTAAICNNVSGIGELVTATTCPISSSW